MRDIKTLLEIMLDNKNLFHSGLCSWASTLEDWEIITPGEWMELNLYITTNRPEKFSSIEAFLSRNSGYYWRRENIRPRIKWIKKHIKKNS